MVRASLAQASLGTGVLIRVLRRRKSVARAVHRRASKMTRKRPSTYDDLTRKLERLAREIDAARAAEPEREAPAPRAVAKGSQRVPVIPTPPPEAELPLRARLEELLRAAPRTFAELALEIEDERLARAFGALKRERKVANVGTDAAPIWAWVIGDDVDTHTLRAAVERLCRMRPFTHAELVWVTGANPNRVKGVITDLKLCRGTSATEPLRDFGTLARGVYFYPPVAGTPVTGPRRKRRKRRTRR